MRARRSHLSFHADRFSARWVDQDARHYARYSELMRHLARRNFERRNSCARLAVLDMAQMMNCSFETGYPDGCGRHPVHGWTRDGLHPHPWVYHQYFVASANVLADLGEACAVAA